MRASGSMTVWNPAQPFSRSRLHYLSTCILYWSGPLSARCLQPMAAASAARRVAPYALVSALRDAGDRWHHARSALCACKAAATAGSGTCSHHHHDMFTQPSTCARDGCERQCECIGHGGRAALHRRWFHFFRRLLMCAQPWIARKLENQLYSVIRYFTVS